MAFATDQTIYPHTLYHHEKGGVDFFVDPNRPNWVATNQARASLLRGLSAPTTVGDV